MFYDKMNDAQQEIKATATVNTSDIAVKANQAKDAIKDVDKVSTRKS